MSEVITSESVSERGVLRVVKELIDSDRRYVCQLSVLVRCYVSVLQRQDSGWKRSLVETKDIAVLFLYIEQIYILSSQFFDLLLQSQVSQHSRSDSCNNFTRDFDSNSNSGILHVLNTIKSFSLLFRLYAQYASIYKQATAALEKVTLTSTALKRFLNEREASGAVRMEALLITPIQRLPRYELLVKEMLSCMDDHDPLVPIAQAAIRCVQKANAFVNESILRNEKRSELLTLQKRFRVRVRVRVGARSYGHRSNKRRSTVILGNGVDRVVKQGVISVRDCQGSIDEVVTVLAILSPKHLTLATQLDDAIQSLQLLVKFHLDKLQVRPQESSSTRLVLRYNYQFRMQRWELYYPDKPTKEAWEEALKIVGPVFQALPTEQPMLSIGPSSTGASPRDIERNKGHSRPDRLLKEVSASEKRFSDELQLLVDCFVQPLLDALGCNNLALICSDLSTSEKGSASKLFSRTDTHLVLHCLLQVRILHEGIAARFAELERRHERSIDVCAEAFNALFPLLKLYDSYHARIDAFLELLQDHTVAKLVAELQRNLHAQGRSFRECIRLPVGRLEVYKAWIRSLKALQHPPPSSLNACLLALEQVTEHLQQTRASKQHSDRLVQIQSSLVKTSFQAVHRWVSGKVAPTVASHYRYPGVPNLMDNTWREVLLEAELYRVKRDGIERCKFWLLSDMLIYARRIKGGLFRFRRALPTQSCVAWADIKKDQSVGFMPSSLTAKNPVNPYWTGNQTAFSLLSPEKAFIVICPSVHVRNTWVQRINSLCSVTANTVGYAAVKFPLNLAPRCQCCGVKVRSKGALKRVWMQHCGACGRACCNACRKRSDHAGCNACREGVVC